MITYDLNNFEFLVYFSYFGEQEQATEIIWTSMCMYEPLETFEYLFETSSPKVGAVGEQQHKRQPMKYEAWMLRYHS